MKAGEQPPLVDISYMDSGTLLSNVFVFARLCNLHVEQLQNILICREGELEILECMVRVEGPCPAGLCLLMRHRNRHEPNVCAHAKCLALILVPYSSDIPSACTA